MLKTNSIVWEYHQSLKRIWAYPAHTRNGRARNLQAWLQRTMIDKKLYILHTESQSVFWLLKHMNCLHVARLNKHCVI